MKKSIVVVIAIILVLSLAACGAKTEPVQTSGTVNTPEITPESTPADNTTIIGQWEYISGGYTYTFNDDGTGTYDAAGTIMNFTYTDDGSTLSILYTGNTSPTELPYKLNGNQVTIKDSFGNDTVYKRK